MNAAAYLDADASALADREHANRDTNTNTEMRQPRGGPITQGAKLPAPWGPRPLSDPHLHELEYGADMFQRGSNAFHAELTRLRTIDVPIDWEAVDRACTTLLRAAVVLHIRALRERERRAA